MSNSLPDLHNRLSLLKKPILESLLKRPLIPLGASRTSTELTLEYLLSTESSVKNFALACALLSASRSSEHELLTWIPSRLSIAAETAFSNLSKTYNNDVPDDGERNLAVALMPEIFPVLNNEIDESSIEKTDEDFAILAAYQFRWFVSQIGYPDLDKMINLVIPCALACLYHWSPEVKGQGMISFIHVAKTVKGAELDRYAAVILKACFYNVASTDEIWEYAVKMTVLLVTHILKNWRPSNWYSRLFFCLFSILIVSTNLV